MQAEIYTRTPSAQTSTMHHRHPLESNGSTSHDNDDVRSVENEPPLFTERERNPAAWVAAEYVQIGRNTVPPILLSGVSASVLRLLEQKDEPLQQPAQWDYVEIHPPNVEDVIRQSSGLYFGKRHRWCTCRY